MKSRFKFFLLIHACCFAEFSLSVDALYWHVTEIIDWSLTLDPVGNVQRTTYHSFDGQWNPAFRIGAGYGNEWETRASYTYYRSHMHDRAKLGAGGIQSAFLGAKIADVGRFSAAKASWRLHYNIFDWDLSRTFLASDRISFRPFIGLKGGTIRQTIHTTWNKTVDVVVFDVFITAIENLKNNFWGVGPQAGVEGKWELGTLGPCTFNLVGDFAAAFMWGHWHITDHYQEDLLVTFLPDDFEANVIIEVKDRDLGALMLKGLLGFGLDFDFKNSHFSMKVGYEIEDWFNQYQVFDNSTGSQNNDLLFQGLTVHVNVDF